ncbi:MAG: bacillithiol biosynthesis deacetylase BshB1 [Promethearchaeota archaeon]
MESLDLLVVGAHPDDAEIGCGATIYQNKLQGRRVGILDLTNGEPTPYGTPEIRAKEAKNAASILNVDVRITLEMPNRYLRNIIEHRKLVADVFRKYKPRVIITHPKKDWHEDHIICHQLVNAAKFQAKLSNTESEFPPYYPPRILYFDHTHIREQRRLDFLYDVSDSFEQKIEALRAYESQFVKNPKNQGIFEILRSRARWLGSQIGTQYAEGFQSPEFFQVNDLFSL